MRSLLVSGRRLLASATGTALVGYTSLMLLFAIAALAVLGQGDVDGAAGRRGTHSLSSQ